MSDQIQRPVFYEGQILGALDLEATVEYSRGQEARHERYLHTWGIADGLQLTTKKKQLEISGTTFDYQEVTVSPGLAVDGRGREIIVAEATRLSEDDFDQLNVAITDATASYPVLLVGRDAAPPASGFTVGRCSDNAATRQIENFEITFLSPGVDLNLDGQALPDVSAGPGSNNGSNNWMVLLGFVKWDKNIKKFTAIADSALGVSPRYAGVLADEVAARNHKLLFRTRVKNTSGNPAMLLDETDGGRLQFGALNATGVVTPVLTVTAKGDVVATGTIKGAFTSGNVYVQSGVATDGLVLPLPSGVAPDQVGAGKATVHIQLTPRLSGLTSPTANAAVATSFQCEVDTDRRVKCLIRWIELNAPNTTIDLPGSCDYTVIVAVPATAGGAS